MSVEISIARRLGDFHLDVTFACGAGVTALFGQSGAGKTSVINMIAGLIRPDRGRIVVDGRVLFDSDKHIDIPSHLRRVGYVFQEGRLFPHLTVRQNLLFGRWFNGGESPLHSLDSAVSLLGLERLLSRRPSTLSGGEKQRVAIGRALLAGPRILLMDEPLASLDAARRAEIMPAIERLRDDGRLPILYVSHALDEVARLADSLVLMAEGRVTATGRVEDVLARLDLPSLTERYEAGAILRARIAEQDDRYALTTLAFPGGALRVPRIDKPIGSALRVRLHARDIAISTKPPEGLSVLNVLKGRITGISAEHGPSVELSLAVGAATILARVTRFSRESLDLQVGQEVYALVKSVAFAARDDVADEPG
ncbi:MAG: molybdenum ABC transporter ATP-binding protein [Alphaproteobacteria bacterium]